MKLKIHLSADKNNLVRLKVLEQEGLPASKDTGHVRICNTVECNPNGIYLRGSNRRLTETGIRIICPQAYIEAVVAAISNEIFSGLEPVKESDVYTWQS